jgi:apolipoprotein N-acyltransferase
MRQLLFNPKMPTRLALAVLGGLFSGPTLPRTNLWILIFPAVIALLLSVHGVRFWRGALLGFIGGTVFYASQSPWLTAYLGPVPWLALSVLMGLIFALGFGVLARVWTWLELNRLVLGRWFLPVTALSLSAIWVAREWVAGNYPYGGYQWSRLAQSQADTFLNRWAYWSGLSGVSFAVALLAVCLTLWILEGKLKQISLLLLIGAVIVVPLVTAIPTSSSSGAVTVGAVQGNANAGLFANPVPGSILAKHIAESKVLATDPEAKNIDFVVWPENASDLDPLSYPPARAAVQNTIDQTLKKPLVLGAVTHRGEEIFNTTVLFQPNIGPTDFYDKQHPVPFAEYVPDRDFWYQLAPDLIGLIEKGFSFGQRDGIFEIGKNKVGSLICFEIANDASLENLVRDGAEVILSQANNADFGNTDETFQQAQLVKLQAIATGRSIVHVSTVGVTQVVLPDGSVSAQLEPFKPGYLISEVPIMKSITPAMAGFGSLNYLCVLSTLVLFILSLGNFKIVFRKKPQSVQNQPKA